jgi:hypothetical protein
MIRATAATLATVAALAGCNVASPSPIATTPHEDTAWDIWTGSLMNGESTCLMERAGVTYPQHRYAITACAIPTYYDATGVTHAPAAYDVHRVMPGAYSLIETRDGQDRATAIRMGEF